MTSAKQEKEENGGAVNMTRMAFETVETVLRDVVIRDATIR